MPTLFIGDVVCLAGTPMKMVVSRLVPPMFAHCTWVDAEGQQNEYPFQIQILEKQDAPRKR